MLVSIVLLHRSAQHALRTFEATDSSSECRVKVRLGSVEYNFVKKLEWTTVSLKGAVFVLSKVHHTRIIHKPKTKIGSLRFKFTPLRQPNHKLHLDLNYYMIKYSGNSLKNDYMSITFYQVRFNIDYWLRDRFDGQDSPPDVSKENGEENSGIFFTAGAGIQNEEERKTVKVWKELWKILGKV